MEHYNGNLPEAVFLQTLDSMDASEAPAALAIVYVISLVGVVSLVTGVFFNRGFVVIFRILAYLLSLATITIAVKNLYVAHDFNYPKFVTCAHFMCCGLLCFGIMAYKRIMEGTPIVIPSMHQQIYMILPISVSFAVSVAANNLALVHVNAAFAEMVAAASPLCTVLIIILMGKHFDMPLIWPTLVVIAGVCVCAAGELKFTWVGLGFLFLSTFLRGVKTTLQYDIMTEGNRVGPIELLAWMSPPCFITIAIWGVLTEGMEPFERLTGENWMPLLGALLLTCVNAMILNVANNYVIKDIGAVGALITAQLKGILIILGACVMLNETITLQQIVGYAGIAGGVYWYNDLSTKIKAKKAETEESTPLQAASK